MKQLQPQMARLLLAFFFALLPFDWSAAKETAVFAQQTSDRTSDEIIKLWPQKPPGNKHTNNQEIDTTKSWHRRVAGRKVIRLGHVQNPEIHVYLPPPQTRNQCAVVICPGGGFSILAWDLEGSEIARQLNSMGISVFVVKYRVPTRHLEIPWQMPAQDLQRALSVIRAQHKKYFIDPNKIGALGFSAGGKTAAAVSFSTKRFYKALDDFDSTDYKPNFVALIYAAQLADIKNDKVASEFKFSDCPPVFLVHTRDDHVSVKNAQILHRRVKQAGASSQLNLYEIGGHGYGARTVDNLPVTRWPKKFGRWLKSEGFTTE